MVSMYCILMLCTTVPLRAGISLAAGLGGIVDTESDEVTVEPQSEFSAGYDLFHPFSDTFSVFTLLNGQMHYGITAVEWSYLYDCSLDFSFRDGDLLIKPSIHIEGELLDSSVLALPDVWENNAGLLLSLEAGDMSFFGMPELSWQKENFFIRGEIGSSYIFSTCYVVTLAVSGGMTVFDSADEEIFITPEVDLSWYPEIPFVLSASLSFTAYDSDYSTDFSEEATDVEILDFYSLSGLFECSTFFAEICTLEIRLPVSMTWKQHGAIVDDELIPEKEWVFSLTPEANLSIFFNIHHSCIVTVACEQAFSNSRYQETGTVSLEVAYELSF